VVYSSARHLSIVLLHVLSHTLSLYLWNAATPCLVICWPWNKVDNTIFKAHNKPASLIFSLSPLPNYSTCLYGIMPSIAAGIILQRVTEIIFFTMRSFTWFFSTTLGNVDRLLLSPFQPIQHASLFVIFDSIF